MIGISNEPVATIEQFIEDQGITFPVLRDDSGVYGLYNLPGAASPYPRDFIIDAEGIIRLAKHEYDPGSMITVIESLIGPTSKIQSKPHLNPQSPVLLSVYPNPFNPDTQIMVDLDLDMFLSINIVNIRGETIQEVISDQSFAAGSHTVQIDGEGLASGIYFVVLRSSNISQFEKIIKLQ